jgi:hypothetical protein
LKASHPPLGPDGRREWAGSSSAAANPGYVNQLKKDSAFQAAEMLERHPAVLLIAALPKNLEESDFFYLSPKGEHIEGWRSGLIKGIFRQITK